MTRVPSVIRAPDEALVKEASNCAQSAGLSAFYHYLCVERHVVFDVVCSV